MNTFLAMLFSSLLSWFSRGIIWFREDWKMQKYGFFGALIFLSSVVIVVCHYSNTPPVHDNLDTIGYLRVVEKVQTSGNIVDATRLPFYPLFIALIYTFAGQGNLQAVGVVQGMLFVLMAVEFYIFVALMFKRSRLAFLIALLVSSNPILLSFCKPIMTEGISLWLLTTILLFSIIFVQTRNHFAFWGTLLFTLFLCFTRPEWQFFPVLLYGYFCVLAFKKTGWKGLLVRSIICLGLIYTSMGLYIVANSRINGYMGLTAIENFNWAGKIMQYKMYDQAPPEYQDIGTRIAYYLEVEKRPLSPYQFLRTAPDLQVDHANRLGDFGQKTALSQPLKFLVYSIKPFFLSFTDYVPVGRMEWNNYFATPLGAVLNPLFEGHRVLYDVNAIFPYCAALWIFLLLWRKTQAVPLVREMALISLVGLYAAALTTLGGYSPQDYMRVHTVFHPLIVLVSWGTLLLGLQTLITSLRQQWQKPVYKDALETK